MKHTSYGIIMTEEERVKNLKEMMWAQVELSRKLIATWPEWKKNILVRSGQSTCSVPRPRVYNVEYDGY